MINRVSDYSSYDIYRSWEDDYKHDKSRFANRNWPGLIQEIVDIFIANKYGIDEMKIYKNHILNFLTTEDGRKRKGNHKNGIWIDNVDVEFDRIVAASYVKLTAHYPQYSGEYLTFRPEIAEWAKKKFNSDNPALIKETHRNGGHLWLEFIKDTCYDK